MIIDLTISTDLAGTGIPDSKLARQITELQPGIEPVLLRIIHAVSSFSAK